MSAICSTVTQITPIFSPVPSIGCGNITCSPCFGIPNQVAYSTNQYGVLSFQMDPRCEASFTFNYTCVQGNEDPCNPVSLVPTTADYTINVADQCDCNLPPSPPSNVVVSQTCDDLIVSWTAANDSCTLQSQLTYLIHIYKDGIISAVVVHTTGAGETSYVATGFTPIPGQDYHATIETIDGCGTGSGILGVSLPHIFKTCVCGDNFVDYNETCDSLNNVCCVGCQFAGPAVECRGSQGVCDIIEYCPANSDICPVDTYQNSNYICRPSAGNDLHCDTPEYCPNNALDYDCPADVFVPPGSPCDTDGSVCTIEICSLSLVCIPNGIETCPASSTCNPLVCEATHGCVTNPIAVPDCSTKELTDCQNGICQNPEGCIYSNITYNLTQCSAINISVPGSCTIGDACGPAEGNVGECQLGTVVCDGNGGILCSGALYSSLEVQDNLDNDCDGVIDEGFGVTCDTTADCVAYPLGCHSVACNTTSHLCVYTPTPAVPCDDGNACTENDQCSVLGNCQGSSVVCPGGDQCHSVQCDTVTGCQAPVPLTGNVCEDNLPCTFQTVCDNGGCNHTTIFVTYDFLDTACIDYSCNPLDGTPIATFTNNLCDDLNACTSGDQCALGNCAGAQNWTPDNIPCTTQQCDPVTGQISTTIIPGYVLIADVCYPDFTLEPRFPCFWANSSQSTNSWVPVPAGALCDDGLFCTLGETCDGTGICGNGYQNGPFPDPTHGPCWHLVCNETIDDFDSVPSPFGTSCSDGNVCNGFEECDGLGVCAPGTPLICPPLDPTQQCFESECIPNVGCETVFLNTKPCNDANACTLNDTCNFFAPGPEFCSGTPKICPPQLCLLVHCDPNQNGDCIYTQDVTKCLIDGRCYSNGDVNPTNPCQVCIGGIDAWSNEPNGFPCLTGNPEGDCSGGDVCVGGQCIDQYLPVNFPCGPVPIDPDCQDQTVCSGESDFCPPPAYHAPGFPCTPDQYECTTDTCNGLGVCIHNDTNCPCSVDSQCVVEPSKQPCFYQNCTDHLCTGDIIVGGYCYLDGACVLDGASDASGCRHCDATTPFQWTSNADGSSCSDGVTEGACSLPDTCSSGVCVSGYQLPSYVCHTDNGVCDPGILCTGQTDQCPAIVYPDTTTVCVSDTIPCTTEFCDGLGHCSLVNTQQCECIDNATCIPQNPQCFSSYCDSLTLSCTPVVQIAKTCFIDGVCYNDGDANPQNECVYCNSTLNVTGWTSDADNTPCGIIGPICFNQDTCQSGICVSGGVSDCSNLNTPCKVYSCNMDNGLCEPSFINQNEIVLACSDENICNGLEICLDGNCAPGTPLPPNPDLLPCLDQSCHAQEGWTYFPTTNPCNDGNACTLGDTCSGGECLPTSNVDCSSLDQTCKVGVCNPADGTCHAEPKPFGTPVPDSNLCNGTETCGQNGEIVPGEHLCCNDNNPCTDDICHNETGCENIPDDNNNCDDGSTCTQFSVCRSGVCVGGPETDCSWLNDPTSHHFNPCMYAICDHSIDGCRLESFPDGTMNCPQDQTVCNGIEQCVAGQCHSVGPLNCDDGNVCTANTCDPLAGCEIISDNVGLPCSDGFDCTVWDMCDEFGHCVGEMVDCTHLDDVCNVGICLEPGISCQRTPRANGTSCADSDPCNGEEVCISGVCNAPCPLDCDDSDPCRGNMCIENVGCEPFTGPLCDDGLFCTTQDTCSVGECNNTITHDCSYLNCDATPCIYYGCVESAQACLPFNFSFGYDVSIIDNDVCNGLESCDGNGGVIHGTPLDCDDHNDCTRDFCDALLGCIHIPLSQTSCDDGLFCTAVDTCEAGVCIGRGEPDCSNFNGPCSTGACSELYQGCYQIISTPGSPCPNGNLCDGDETCNVDGICVSGTPLDCDDHSVCTDDHCSATGGCWWTFNTGPCEDGRNCTVNDVCQAGTCVSGPIKNCSNIISEPQCQNAVCDELSGECLIQNHPDGSYCNDTNACTDIDTCEQGFCVSGLSVDCNDQNDCTRDFCDVVLGCQYDLLTNVSCDDSIYCTENDVCTEGDCIPGTPRNCEYVVIDHTCEIALCNETHGCYPLALPDGTPCGPPTGFCGFQNTCLHGRCHQDNPRNCSDENPCTIDTCNPETSQCDHTPAVGLTCDDQLYCTISDMCNVDGVCVGVPRDCSSVISDIQCQFATCNEDLDICVPHAQPGPCNADSSVCTNPDICIDGFCHEGPLISCDDQNPCTLDICDPILGCAHRNYPDGYHCSDGIFCNGEETCLVGVCMPGEPPECQRLSTACSTGFCNETIHQCDTLPANEDSICEFSFDLCVANATCVLGECIPKIAVDCNDNNACTDDCCSPLTGCYYTFNHAPCDDGDVCTDHDTCLEGSCAPGTPVDCSCLDSACTDGVCNQRTGECDAVPKNDGVQCDDGKDCTELDRCSSGSCVGLQFVPGSCLLPSDQCSYLDVCGVCGGDNSTCALAVARSVSDSIFSNPLPPIQVDCQHGIVSSDRCICQRGWTGDSCNTCSVSGDIRGTKFICMSTFDEQIPYVLREISDEHVETYLSGLLPVGTKWPSIRPGTTGNNGNVYDCSCEASVVARRDINSVSFLYIENQYRSTLSLDDAALESCQYSQLVTKQSTKSIEPMSSESSEEALEDDDHHEPPHHDDDGDDDGFPFDHHDPEVWQIVAWVFIAATILLIVIVVLLLVYYRRDTYEVIDSKKTDLMSSKSELPTVQKSGNPMGVRARINFK